MKPVPLQLLCVFLIALSCKNAPRNPTLKDFCMVKPRGWNCEIIEGNFNTADYPESAGYPLAIIKYQNLDKEFVMFRDKKLNPSLILAIYAIHQKIELIDLRRSQPANTWCIPIYYGETNDFFIITSPCLINNGSDTDEAEFCISDLQYALESIISIHDYNFLGNWHLQ